MKVGDLVELSAQGRKLKWLEPLTGMYGIVVSQHSTRWKVQWFGRKGGKPLSHWHTLDRRSLRLLRR